MSKKDFSDIENPAMQFISSAAPTEEGRQTAKKQLRTSPSLFKPDYNVVEKRTKRVQLVGQPSLIERAKAKAKTKGQSLNTYINELIENDLKGDF